MKEKIKQFIKLIPIDFTQNQQYDTQTKAVIKKVCKANSNCIDVGCHKGEVLDIIFKHAPNGQHMAFEPIPVLFEQLQLKYQHTSCILSDVALSNHQGTSTFNYVISNPAYSGLIKRSYDHHDVKDEVINVQTDRLDHLIPPDLLIDLIKIDVEGGELGVLEGAIQTIQRCKPVIIFEHGLGASEFYQTTPEKVYDFFTQCGLKVSTMKRWLNHDKGFTLNEFKHQFEQRINYYFIAYAE